MSTDVHGSRWSRPVAGIAAVAVLGAGLGAFFGIRAVQGAGSAPAAGQPPARTGAAMAYDALDGTVVLFGGQSRAHTLTDTWIWGGSGWTQARPVTSPPTLDNPQMAYDPVSHDVVLVGDQQIAGSSQGPIVCSGGSGSASSGSTGSGTTFIPPANPIPAIAPVPSASSRAKAGTGVAQPVCGISLSPSAVTWLWNGRDWSKASGSTPFTVFGSGELATDPVSNRVVLIPRGPFAVPALGAAQPAIACPVRSPAPLGVQPACPWPIATAPAWTWNGHAWKVVASNVGVSSFDFFGSSVVSDAVSGKLATFGGNFAQPVPIPFPCKLCLGGNGLQPSAARTGTESIWNGTSWKRVITYTSGPSLPGVAIVGDPAARSDVALSGDGQTWLWTGVWTRVHPGSTPPVVSGAAAVFDAATGQVVLFGGIGTTSRTTGFYDQTWTWDGSDWTQRGGSAGPSVTIPVPSPISIPPSAPCFPVSPATPAGIPVPKPAAVCNGGSGSSAGGSAGSSGAISGAVTGSEGVAP
ncbi:MAG: hypothetical protein ACHQ4F_11415 [Candidatus Dormibacteria bacterium]